jgi:hypothetical protein
MAADIRPGPKVLVWGSEDRRKHLAARGKARPWLVTHGVIWSVTPERSLP